MYFSFRSDGSLETCFIIACGRDSSWWVRMSGWEMSCEVMILLELARYFLCHCLKDNRVCTALCSPWFSGGWRWSLSSSWVLRQGSEPRKFVIFLWQCIWLIFSTFSNQFSEDLCEGFSFHGQSHCCAMVNRGIHTNPLISASLLGCSAQTGRQFAGQW